MFDSNEESAVRIASVFLNDAELQFETMPSTLQDLIDALPDHNQQMLDAIKAVDPELFVRMNSALCGEDKELQQVAFNMINNLFKLVNFFMEQSA